MRTLTRCAAQTSTVLAGGAMAAAMRGGYKAGRVLVFTREVLPYSQTFVREQALALRRWRPTLVGLEPVVADGLDPAPLDSCTLEPQVRRGWARLPVQLREWFWVAHPEHILRLRSARYAPGFALIHAHFGTSAVWFWPIACRLRLPMLVTLHGYDITVRPEWWESGAGGFINRPYPSRLRQLARGGARFIAVSQGVRAQAIRYGLAADRVTVRYIGIDTGRFCMRGVPVIERRRRIVFIGRLVEKKGCEYLIRAAAWLRARLPDVQLVIIGDGPLQGPLEQCSQALGVQALFTGALTHEAVREQLDQARVVCVPSIRSANGDAEGLPMVVLEAQACGVPVVTSAQLASGEGLSHGVTGFCCPERDPETLAQRLLQVLTDDALAASMSHAAAALMRERFELSHHTRQLESLYDDVARGAAEEAARVAAHSS